MRTTAFVLTLLALTAMPTAAAFESDTVREACDHRSVDCDAADCATDPATKCQAPTQRVRDSADLLHERVHDRAGQGAERDQSLCTGPSQSMPSGPQAEFDPRGAAGLFACTSTHFA